MEGIKISLLDAFIDAALREDIKDGDHTSLACIDSYAQDDVQLIVKDSGVIAGVDFAKHVFHKLDPNCEFEVLIPDGTQVKYGDVAFRVKSFAQTLLKGERLVLNTMQRLSNSFTVVIVVVPLHGLTQTPGQSSGQSQASSSPCKSYVCRYVTCTRLFRGH